MIKIKTFVMMVGIAVTFLQAESRESYLPLTNTLQAERYLLSFTKFELFHELFPNKQGYIVEVKRQFERYTSSLQQVSIDLKDGEYASLLTRFLDAKNLMKGLVQSKGSSESLLRLIRLGRILEKDIDRMASARRMKLTSSQRLLYALRHMQMLLEGMSEDTLVLFRSPGDTRAKADLQKRIQVFNETIQQCRAYAFPMKKETHMCKRIVQTWDVLKQQLKGQKRPMIVELGAMHLSALIEELRKWVENEGGV